LPSLAVASTLFVAWTNLIAARPIMQRRGLYFPDFGRLNHWRAPDPLVWGVIGCGLIMLLPDTGIRLVGVNGLLVLLTDIFHPGHRHCFLLSSRKRNCRGPSGWSCT
jgi:hypothetical protein